MIRTAIVLAAVTGIASPVFAVDQDIADRVETYATTQLSGWLDQADLLQAIKSQNEKHAGLSQSEIDTLDQTWRAEADASDQPMIDDLLSRSTSEYLRDMQMQTDGIVTEVFLMDNLGLNVAQSDATSDYWQGDEAKFQETFGVGSGTIHIGEIELDESSGAYQIQVSMTISDPADGSPIGAATFGLTME